MESERRFDEWNELKKSLQERKQKIRFKNKDILFISIGQNVGFEQYGKGKEFLRPVLVFKKLSSATFLGIPLTSSEKEGNYYFSFKHKGKISTAMFNQIRVFDINRVKFFYGTIGRNTFEKLQQRFNEFIEITSHRNGKVGTSVQKDVTILPQTQTDVNPRLFLSPPHMSGREQQYIAEVFESNYIAPLGDFVDRFEKRIRDYTGAQHALATNTATAALHLALRVLGIGAGDTVLVSTFTFIGSVNAILYQNAKPIFVDSDGSWNLSPELLAKAIEEAPKKPKALIVTHLYGQMAKMGEIIAVCRENGIFVIEDAAESLGATLHGKQSGTFGDMGVYSFNGNKILTTSGGGMLVSGNPSWIEKAKFLSTQAKENTPYYEHKTYGYNYRMSNVLAAIGVAQMEVLEERVRRRRAIFGRYRERLGGYEEIRFMPEIAGSRGNRWLTTLTLEHTDPYGLMRALEAEQIESRPLWRPMHLQPLFQNAIAVTDGTSQKYFETGICLPSGSSMRDEDVDRVCRVVERVLR